ncbi:MAG: septum formation initiator family protein [Defluviitaleaceae bacterium]|nr:septum formation initiator family protein [Defluviitaleaceae bacterium]
MRIDKIKKRRRNFAGAKALALLAVLVVIIVSTFVYAGYTMGNIGAAEAELAATRQQIEAAEARQREIEDSAAYVNSKEFVEYIARNWLNLVRRGEIIFIMTD